MPDGCFAGFGRDRRRRGGRLRFDILAAFDVPQDRNGPHLGRPAPTSQCRYYCKPPPTGIQSRVGALMIHRAGRALMVHRAGCLNSAGPHASRSPSRKLRRARDRYTLSTPAGATATARAPAARRRTRCARSARSRVNACSPWRLSHPSPSASGEDRARLLALARAHRRLPVPPLTVIESRRPSAGAGAAEGLLADRIRSPRRRRLPCIHLRLPLLLEHGKPVPRLSTRPRCGGPTGAESPTTITSLLLASRFFRPDT